MFRIHALPVSSFEALFALDDEQLAAHHIRRVVADGPDAYPCRVSLRDANVGESLLLMPFTHHDVASPYRASGPIYVLEGASRAAPAINEVPEQLRRRLLSVRAYGDDGMMRIADVADGKDVASTFERFFARDDVAYLHVHYARYGCYASRVTREG